MDPREVYVRPSNSELTPLQIKAFDIVDGFLEDNTPALLDWYPRPDHRVLYEHHEDGTKKRDRDGNPIPRQYDQDERYNYWLLVKRGGVIYRLMRWEKGIPEEMGWRALPTSQWNEDRVLRFNEIEKALQGQLGTATEDLPLTREDLTAIGLDPEEQEVNG